MLEINQVTKTFGDFTAVDKLSMNLRLVECADFSFNGAGNHDDATITYHSTEQWRYTRR